MSYLYLHYIMAVIIYECKNAILCLSKLFYFWHFSLIQPKKLEQIMRSLLRRLLVSVQRYSLQWVTAKLSVTCRNNTGPSFEVRACFMLE